MCGAKAARSRYRFGLLEGAEVEIYSCLRLHPKRQQQNLKKLFFVIIFEFFCSDAVRIHFMRDLLAPDLGAKNL